MYYNVVERQQTPFSSYVFLPDPGAQQTVKKKKQTTHHNVAGIHVTQQNKPHPPQRYMYMYNNMYCYISYRAADLSEVVCAVERL